MASSRRSLPPGPGYTGPTVTERDLRAGRKRDPLRTSARWWKQPEDQVYRHVLGVVEAVATRQSFRLVNNRRWYRLYANDIFATGVGGGSSLSSHTYATKGRYFTWNVIESCVNAAQAKVAKNIPKPRILTSQGSFRQRKKAKLLTKYLKGMMTQLDLADKAQLAFRDACVLGKGALKFFIEDDQVKCKRVLLHDIVVDEHDAEDGMPRQLHHRGRANKDVLCELYADDEAKVAKIMAAGSVHSGDTATPASEDIVAVTESWHLPSSAEAKDGLHTICTDNCTLFSEPWEHEWFPFAFIEWQNAMNSFYGKGIAEQLAPIQLVINKLINLIEDSIETVARPNLIVPNASQVIAQQVSAKIGAIIRTNGAAPIPMVPTPQHEQVYAWVETQYKRAFEITGISQLAAQSQKPAGLNSGAALREFKDTETQRFAIVGQAWEKMFMDAARIVIALSKQLYKDGISTKVKVKGRGFVETVDWKDAELDDDEFNMDVFPVNSLPDDPAGRLQAITELAQAGYLSKETSFDLLDFPDLDEAVSVQVAAIENARMVVDRARWEGERTVVTPLMNLTALRDLAHNEYLDATTMDTPEPNLAALLDLINQAQAMIDASQPPPQPAPAGQGAAPIAQPEPNPTSPLVPIPNAA